VAHRQGGRGLNPVDFPPEVWKSEALNPDAGGVHEAPPDRRVGGAT